MKYCAAFTLFVLTTTASIGQKTSIERGPLVHYRQGVTLFENGKFNSAISEFREYMAGGNEKMLLTDAKYYIAASKLKLQHLDGVAAVEEFVLQNPDSRKLNDANFSLGDYYFNQRQFSKALSYYKIVDITAVPEYDIDRFMFNKGYAFLSTKKYDMARETLEPLTIRPNKFKIKATYYYGYACYYTGRYNEALKAFNSIEKDGPQTLKLYVAQIYYLKGDYKKAIEYCDKIKLEGLQKKLQFLKGKCYYRLAEYENAGKFFEQSNQSLDSINRNEIYEIGFTYYKNKNYTKSLEYLSLIANNGDSLAQIASFNLADVFLKTNKKQNAFNAFYEAQRNNFDKKVREKSLFNYAKLGYELEQKNAVVNFQKYLEEYPSGADADEARGYLADLLVEGNDYKTAVKILESISTMDQKMKTTYQKVTFYSGQEYLKIHDNTSAKALFQKSLLYKNDKQITAETYYALGEIDFSDVKYYDAKTNYQKFIDITQSANTDYYPNVFYNMGYCYFRLKKYADAKDYFTQYRQNSTKGKYDEGILMDAMLRLGDCHYMGKNFTSAIDAYSYVSGRNATGTDYALFQRGMIYGYNKQPQQKISTLKRIPDEYRNSPMVPDAIYEIANEHRKLSNYKEAERNFFYLIEDFSGNPLVKNCRYTLGLMYSNDDLKQNDKALEQFKIVYVKYPKTQEAANSLKRIKSIYESQGKAKEFITWVQSVGGSISINEQDSLLYSAAYKKYLEQDFAIAISAFNDYLGQFKAGYFFFPANYYKARCHENLKQYDNAIYHYKQVADGNINDFQEDASSSAARMLVVNKNDCTGALTYYEKLENISRTNQRLREAVIGQVRCHNKLGHKDQAFSKARQFLNYEGTYPEQIAECNNIMGKVSLENKSYIDALSYFQKSYTKSDDINGAEGKYYEALTYFKMDSLVQTKKSIFQFNEQFSTYDYWLGKSFILLGDYYYRKNDQFQAKATWNSTIENFSDIDEIVKEAQDRLNKLKNGEPIRED